MNSLESLLIIGLLVCIAYQLYQIVSANKDLKSEEFDALYPVYTKKQIIDTQRRVQRLLDNWNSESTKEAGTELWKKRKDDYYSEQKEYFRMIETNAKIQSGYPIEKTLRQFETEREKEQLRRLENI